MSVMRYFCIGVAVLLVGPVPELLGAHLRGRIVRVGFQGSGRDPRMQGTDQYRPGRWTPVLVELTNHDGDLFEGRLETRQTDRDGDTVLASTRIALRDTRRFYLYVPASGMQAFHAADGRSPFLVRVYEAGSERLAPLFDQNAEPISYLEPPRQAQPVPQASVVVLDISEKPVNLLNRLIRDTTIRHEVVVSRSSPSELPDHMVGLDMVDIIVWDGANPAALDITQREALTEWVRQGGRLVLGVSRNWNLVVNSRFRDLLPAVPDGTATTSTPSRAMEEALGVTLDLNAPLSYCPLTSADLAPGAVAVIPHQPGADDLLLAAERPWGRGRVVLVAAEINDLLEYGTTNDNFLREVTSLRTFVRPSESQLMQRGWSRERNLFVFIEQLTAFTAMTGLYFLLAFGFVGVYIMLATFGSWSVLKRRGLLRQTWTAFAVTAVVGSMVSLAAVRGVRGFGQRVEEISIVDGRAGGTEAVATCYLGLKTASHVRLDLHLPSDWRDPENAPAVGGALRPLPFNLLDPLGYDRVYSAGDRYEAVAGLGQLRSVPIRATLKQFEGHWHGELSGRISASIRREHADSPYLHPDAWIENQLGTRLTDCHLLVTRHNIRTAQTSRALQTFVYEIGTLNPGDRVRIGDVLERLRRRRGGDTAGQRLEEELAGEAPETVRPRTLSALQSGWLDTIGLQGRYPQWGQTERVRVDVDRTTSALMLLSLYDEVSPNSLEHRGTLERSEGHRLDCSATLNRDTVLLIGFSRDPGPARLCWREAGVDRAPWKPVHPSSALVMYRLAIPIGGR